MISLAENFAALINRELKLFERLLEILESEKTALTDNNVQLLESTTQAKTAVVQELADVGNQRTQLLNAKPILDSEGIPDFLAVYASKQDVLNWQQLLAAAKLAQENNRLNGLLINQISIRTQNALNVLHGSENRNTSLYDPKGQNTTSRRQRTIIS
mgnify:CR=1 FL=1